MSEVKCDTGDVEVTQCLRVSVIIKFCLLNFLVFPYVTVVRKPCHYFSKGRMSKYMKNTLR